MSTVVILDILGKTNLNVYYYLYYGFKERYNLVSFVKEWWTHDSWAVSNKVQLAPLKYRTLKSVSVGVCGQPTCINTRRAAGACGRGIIGDRLNSTRHLVMSCQFWVSPRAGRVVTLIYRSRALHASRPTPPIINIWTLTIPTLEELRTRSISIERAWKMDYCMLMSVLVDSFVERRK